MKLICVLGFIKCQLETLGGTDQMRFVCISRLGADCHALVHNEIVTNVTKIMCSQSTNVFRVKVSQSTRPCYLPNTHTYMYIYIYTCVVYTSIVYICVNSKYMYIFPSTYFLKY